MAQLRHRLSRLSAVALLAAALTGGVPAGAAHARLAPQEPGVTLRVFDVQTPLTRICTLKPAQTPNIDKLMATINWSGADFGIEDHFVAQALANLTVPVTGSYTFRLSSDDGSRLTVDDVVVVDHDGPHGTTAKDGAAELTAGVHPLRIDHFERDGGQQLTLEWRRPGASAFEVVPSSALSTESGVVRVTAPGRKECEQAGDTPGDGLPLTGVHPGYSLTSLRPAGFEPRVTGMDWLPDGRLAVLTWGGSDDSGSSAAGEVYLLDNVTGSTGPGSVSLKKIAGGLKEPMGLKIVDGVVYVCEKARLTRLVDADGDEVADRLQTVATWPYGGNFHEFAFGLLYDAPNFYLNLSVSINYGGNTTDPQPAPNRGTTIEVNKDTGAISYVAGGLRTPHGIGWGPENGVFVTDNQGGWLPSSKLVHIKQDRFFNHYTNPAGPFDAKPVTPPALWMPQNEIANSPSTPVLLKQGVFAGQMLIGDVTYGGLQRAYLEKVNGEYQGALFRLTQGLEAGVSEVSLGPDGAVYAGGLGAGGNWGQTGKLKFGLQKLTPNGKNTFDMLAMRARPGGFEIEYTSPVSTETANALAAKYTVKQWRYQPTTAYGGPKIGEQALAVTSASLSADRKKVTLAIAGLKPGHVVHLRSPRPFSSATGETLWSTEAWYTLNALPGVTPPAPNTYQAEEAANLGGAGVNTNHAGYTGSGFVDGYGTPGAATTFTVTAATAGAYDVALRYANGPDPFTGTKKISLHVNGVKLRQTALADTGAWATWAQKTESVPLNAGGNTITYRYDSGDDGHVNLDAITISGGVGPIRGIGGKCVDVDNAGTANGTKIQLWTCNGSSAQQWSRVGATLQALGKCLDVAGSGTANGTKVQLWTCNGSGAQVWQPQPNGSVLNPQSGKVLDAAAAATADGTQIHIWAYAGGANQHWVLSGAS
ncbi:ricin-type beta-trefoil lectin domain protein [Actinoplanes sp. NEAU-A12]|uniref:Ricin-type beta-trefoil lectin domain protein n=1 Tax=Actinoplanes sandaracinus TaxID=3045177 RepID=A0ABT6WGE7_9ACTN|nr:ricin-type beta-trefoil lectin domain protein [Actinoplanes sandaracinus]MDI6098802.1 ricin-type beta-trefoil lectin domain protein [Actinoplanes sandaracinus]